jgi:hypothetical protein
MHDTLSYPQNKRVTPSCCPLRKPLKQAVCLKRSLTNTASRRGPSERFVPVLLQPPAAGHKGALSPSRHEPFQSISPSLPDHSLHETSSYVPSIARMLPGKNSAGAPESVHRSKLRADFFSAHYKARQDKARRERRARRLLTAWVH